MPWLLALSALFGTGYLLLGEARKSGLTPLDSQANQPSAAASIASRVNMTPRFSPSWSITRTFGDWINSL